MHFLINTLLLTLAYMCMCISQEIARHLRPETLRAIFGKTKMQNAVHCTDLPEDGLLEVRPSSAGLLLTLQTHQQSLLFLHNSLRLIVWGYTGFWPFNNFILITQQIKYTQACAHDPRYSRGRHKRISFLKKLKFVSSLSFIWCILITLNPILTLSRPILTSLLTQLYTLFLKTSQQN